MEPSATTTVVRFGPFVFDPTAGDLRHRGRRIRVQEKPLRLLQALVDRAGTVVTREELRKRLWDDDTFVDFENGLNNAVSRMRAALGDSVASPRFIETLGRRGYRFIARVERIERPLEGSGGESVRRVRAWLVGHPGRLPLLEGENILGRESDDVIELASSTVSRRHAKITIDDDAVIEDLGSRNGTFVNGRPVAGRVPLADGARVRVGSFLLTFRCARARGSTRTRSSTS